MGDCRDHCPEAGARLLAAPSETLLPNAAQVSICGHTADGGSSTCSPVNSGQLFIGQWLQSVPWTPRTPCPEYPASTPRFCSPPSLSAAIAPFTFFPILILWALSCWCCLKENDIGEPRFRAADAAPVLSAPRRRSRVMRQLSPDSLLDPAFISPSATSLQKSGSVCPPRAARAGTLLLHLRPARRPCSAPPPAR